MEKNVSGEYYVMTVFDSQNPTLNQWEQSWKQLHCM